jgi:hypothetical protein
MTMHDPFTPLDPGARAGQRNGASCGSACGGPDVGAFVSCTAFRTTDAAALSAAICAYVAAHGVSCTAVAVNDEFTNNTRIFQPKDGWTVVFWPDYFVGFDVPAAAAITRDLHLLASVVFVADGGYWAHVLIENGETLDRFCCRPAQLCSHPSQPPVDAQDWRGNAVLLARKFGVTESALAPYLRNLDAEAEAAKPPKPGFFARFFAPAPPPFVAGAAFKDDEYDLDDYDVFADFWRRAGIHWPVDMELAEPAFCWRFGEDFAEKLPR